MCQQSSLINLDPLFSNISKIQIYFFSDIKTSFIYNFSISQDFQISNILNIIQNQQSTKDLIFFDEIYNFSNDPNIKSFLSKSISKLWKIISSSITGYIIKQSYDKLKDNQNTTIFEKEVEEEDYITLRNLGTGSSFRVKLIYHIDKSELFAIKTPIFKSDTQDSIDREIKNYQHLDFPLLPKFYGFCKTNKSIIIQYINGQTLLNIRNINLDEKEKITNIYELMIIIEYLHLNNFVYRDLKPDNVIINENKDVFLIDFDNMIKFNETTKECDHTKNFGHNYVSPEVSLGKITYKNDIYSIGQMIYYLFKEENPPNNACKNITTNEKYQQINQIYKLCTEESENKRPYIFQLTYDFYQYFSNQIQESIIKKVQFDIYNLINNIHIQDKYQIIPQFQNNLGNIYYLGEYIERDINKAIHYYSLAVNQNIPQAQYNLGNIYYLGKYIERNINKAIHYYSLAANQNIPEAQYNLGVIYSEAEYIERDINKAIHYYSLAADQNYPEAQHNLGNIYFFGEYIERNINKAIYYYSLAANQNIPEAQYNLGVIYSEAEYIERDINKAIHYYSLAADQNYPKAQFYLGNIYYFGKYIERDINKAIHYYSLAANQNHPEAQYNLGDIYYFGKYIERNINKAIHYYSFAANQNYPEAQYNLGVIYSEAEYIERDINKAIHYYSLAADQNYPQAQYNLGDIYFFGEYIERDINKAIHYYSLAANQNYPPAQFILAHLYSIGWYIKKDIYKGIDFYIQSASNGNKNANFVVGYFYQEGKYVEKDINKSIHNYKEASSFNNQYAKNNLGILYRHGSGEQLSQNIGMAIDYFDEAIRRFNDKVSIYNLSHICIYEDQTKERLETSIELLIKSINEQFYPSTNLLCISLIKLYVYDIEKILEKITEKSSQTSEIPSIIIGKIIDEKLDDRTNFEAKYLMLKEIDYMYNFLLNIIPFNIIEKPKADEQTNQTIQTRYNITSNFYDGFNS